MSISLTRSHNMENLAAVQLPRGRQVKREGQQIGLPTSESKRTKHSALTSLQKILPNRPTIRVKKSVLASAADKARQGPGGTQGDRVGLKGDRVVLKGERRGVRWSGKEAIEDQENVNPNCPQLPGGREKKSFFSNPFTKKKVLGTNQEQEPTILKSRPTTVSEKRKAAVSGAENRKTAVSRAENRKAAVSGAENRKAAVSGAENRKTAVSGAENRKAAVSAAENRKTAVSGAENRKTAVAVRTGPTAQGSKGTRVSATSHLPQAVVSQSQRIVSSLPQVSVPTTSKNVAQSHLAAPQMKRRPLGQLPAQSVTNSDSSSSSVSDLVAANQNVAFVGDRIRLVSVGGVMNQSLNSSFLHTFSKMNTADQLAYQRAGKENPPSEQLSRTTIRAPLLPIHVSAPATCQLLPETTEVSVTPEKNDVIMLSPPQSATIVPLDPLGDIDRISADSIYCPEYAPEIFRYLKSCEVRYMPRPAYLTRQQDINEGMRSILVDWLVEVSEEYKMTSQTLYLAVNYVDRFLSGMSVSRTKLQLVGTCCMYVASKFEEIYPPDLAEFVFITDDTYSKGQMVRMEALLLKALEFNLLAPTAHMFAERFLRGMDSAPDQLKHLLSYLCELALLSHRIAIRYRPSLVAAASLSVAAETLGRDPWSGHLERHTGYSWRDLQECRGLLLDHFRSAPSLQQQAIQEKYRSADRSAVSQLCPPLPRQVRV